MNTAEDIRLKVSIPDDAARELRRVLQSVRLPEDGIFYEGEHLVLLASLWDSERQPDCFDVVLSAQSPDGQRYTLEKLLVYARGREGDREFVHIARRIRTGDLVLDSLRKRIPYQLHCPELAEVGYPTVTVIPGAVTAKQVPPAADHAPSYAMAARSVQSPRPAEIETDEPPARQDFASLGQPKLYGTIEEQAPGRVLLRFGTAEQSLAGATVWFGLVDTSSARLLCEGTCRLEKAPATRYWEGRHPIDALPVHGPVALVFHVVDGEQ